MKNYDEIFDCEYFDGELVNDEWQPPHCTVLSIGSKDIVDLEIPCRIEHEYEEYCVTEIADRAFSGLRRLHSLTLPPTVKEVGANAFSDCEKLQTVTFGGGEATIGCDAFKGCTSLSEVRIRDLGSLCETTFTNEFSNPIAVAKRVYYTNGELLSDGSPVDIVLPKRVYSLKKGCFFGMKVRSLTVTSDLYTISPVAFDDCGALVRVKFADIATDFDPRSLDKFENLEYSVFGGLKYLGDGQTDFAAVAGIAEERTDYTLHADAKAICNHVFENAARIEKIYLPASLKHVGRQAFYNCKALCEIHVPDVVQWCNIYFIDIYRKNTDLAPAPGAKLFFGDAAAEDVVVSPPIDYIAPYRFSSISNVKTVVVSDGVMTIGEYAFADCPSLERVTIADSADKISRFAFRNCTALKTARLAPTKYLGDGAFQGCVALEDIDMPHATRELPTNCFKDCTSLKRMEIADGVKFIESGAFEGCTGLKEVVLPETLKSIHWDAFKGCTSLETITFPRSLLNICDRAFQGCTSLKTVEIPVSTEISDDVFLNCHPSLKIIRVG